MPVTLRARRLFDGERFVDVPAVTIDGERITAVGRDAGGGDVVDLDGATLLPGLVDAHQHLVFDGDGSLEEQVADRSDDELRERARRHARRALVAGITTLRDLGDRGYVTLDLRGERGLPRILASGPPITRVGGHCWFLGGEVEPGGLADAVRERHRRGCDVVKVMATGGMHTPTFPVWEPQFDADELAGATALAHELGLPVAAHCHGQQGMVDVVAAGVDTVEHGGWLTPELRFEVLPEVRRRMIEQEIVTSATLGSTPELDPPAPVKALLPVLIETLAEHIALGGRVVVGTDGGIEVGKQHDVLPWAGPQLVELGVSGEAMLATLTSRAADAIGLGAVTGRVVPGLSADLLAVAGDPDEDPTTLRDVAAVWSRGDRVVTGPTTGPASGSTA